MVALSPCVVVHHVASGCAARSLAAAPLSLRIVLMTVAFAMIVWKTVIDVQHVVICSVQPVPILQYATCAQSSTAHTRARAASVLSGVAYAVRLFARTVEEWNDAMDATTAFASIMIDLSTARPAKCAIAAPVSK